MKNTLNQTLEHENQAWESLTTKQTYIGYMGQVRVGLTRLDYPD